MGANYSSIQRGRKALGGPRKAALNRPLVGAVRGLLSTPYLAEGARTPAAPSTGTPGYWPSPG